MKNYTLKIDFGNGIRKEKQASLAEVIAIRGEALENAKVAIQSAPSDIKHFVYYTELGSVAHVYTKPIEMTDASFYGRLDIVQPDYIGALHRR